MFNGKFFNEKFLLKRKYYDFTHAINCTRKLTCLCACVCREQYVFLFIQLLMDFINCKTVLAERYSAFLCESTNVMYSFKTASATLKLMKQTKSS